MAAKAQASSKNAGKAPKNVPAVTVASNLEDDADMMDETEASSAGPSGPKPEEAVATLTQKNFRNHPDMENFFRFIHDNDLRLEALQIIDEVLDQRQAGKGPKVKASQKK